MKRLIPLAALLACLLSASARADNWGDYNKLMSRYYQIDKQETQSISCAISASPLEEVVKQMPDIAGQLSKFRVAVQPDGEISFTLPRVRINNSDDLTKGLNMIVGGVKTMTGAVLESLVTQKQEKLKELAVTAKGEATTVAFTSTEEASKGDRIEMTYSGDKDETNETSKEGVMNSTTKYTSLNGKLAPLTSVAHRDGDDPLDASIALKYQQVGKTWFPARITTDVKDKQNPNGQHVVVDFRDCSGT